MYDGMCNAGAVVGLYHILRCPPQPGSCGYTSLGCEMML